MAASDAKPIPRKNVAYRTYFPILDADGDLVTDANGLLGLVSTDAASFVTVASAPVQVSVSSGVYFCDLSASEMNGDGVVLKVSSSTAGAKTSVIVMYPADDSDIRVNVREWANSPVVSVGVAGTPKVDVSHWLSTAAATPTVAGVPEVDVTHWNGTVVGSTQVRANIVQVDNAPITSPAVTGVLNVNVTHAAGTAWASGAITAASIATGAVDADAIAADAVTEIQSGLATQASVNSVNSDVVAIKSKTDQMNFTSGSIYSDLVRVDHAPITSPAVTGVLNVNTTHAAGTAWASGAITAASIATGAVDADAVAADAVTEIQSGLATAASLNSVNADVVAIKAKTDGLTFTVAGKVDANATHISGASESADRLERSTLSIVLGTVGVSSTTTLVIASALDPTSAVNDQFIGRIITFDKDTATAALRGQATDITDYVHATLAFTVTALTTAPASGDTFTIT